MQEITNKDWLNKIQRSPLYGKHYSFKTRDIQTSNMHNLSQIIFDELKKHNDSVIDSRTIQVLLKLFFGGMYLDTKIKYVKSLNLKPESKSKIIDFMKNVPLFSDEEHKGFEFGITRTVAIAAKNFTGKDKELILDFIKTLIAMKDLETIKSKLFKIDEQGINYFTPGIVSNLLFAYNPKIFYIWNKPVQKGLEKNFDISLDYNTFSFKDYFEYLPIFEIIKTTFNLTDYGQVDSMITGFSIVTDKNSIQYWAGGFHWGDGSHFDEFIRNKKWEIGHDKSSKKGKLYYEMIKRVKNNDRFALKTLGARYKLKIYAIGTVIDNSKREDGILFIRWDKTDNLYSGRAPEDEGKGNWFGTLKQITNPNAIRLIFGEKIITQQIKLHSKNIILYGPPGTGKTFKTKEMAIQIIEK